MNETYELWDRDAGNVVGEFPTEEEALDVVGTMLRSFGRDHADELALLRRDGSAGVAETVTGEDLRRLLDAQITRLAGAATSK